MNCVGTVAAPNPGHDRSGRLPNRLRGLGVVADAGAEVACTARHGLNGLAIAFGERRGQPVAWISQAALDRPGIVTKL